jgi:hypothetical protein
MGLIYMGPKQALKKSGRKAQHGTAVSKPHAPEIPQYQPLIFISPHYINFHCAALPCRRTGLL